MILDEIPPALTGGIKQIETSEVTIQIPVTAPTTQGLVRSKTLSRFGRAALRYAELGFAVFACKPREKIPATPHGFKDATRDPQKIIEQWTKCPNFNVAIATGPISGVGVLDFDLKSGFSAVEAMESLEAEFGKLPTTPHQLTGNYGLQFFFGINADIPSRTRLRPNTDFKCSGGYVLASPSPSCAVRAIKEA